MKKSIIAGAFFTFMMLAAPMIGNSSCSVTRQCGGVGTITCTGANPCFMAKIGTLNPWVSCGGEVSYCFGSPDQEVT